MSFEDVLKQQTKSPKELEKENIDWFVEAAAKHFQNSCLAKAHAGKHSHFEYAECGEAICSYSKKIDMYNRSLYYDSNYEKYGRSDLVRFVDAGLEDYFVLALSKKLNEIDFSSAKITKKKAYITEGNKEYAPLKSFFKGIEVYNYKTRCIATVTVFVITADWQ